MQDLTFEGDFFQERHEFKFTTKNVLLIIQNPEPSNPHFEIDLRTELSTDRTEPYEKLNIDTSPK